MRKLDVHSEKVQEVLLMLTELQFEFKQLKDSIDVSVVGKEERKRLTHELNKIFVLHKSPPLTTSYDETTGVVSIFDQRI